MANKKQSTAGSSAWVIVLQVLRYLLQFAYLVLMSRYLTPSDFGLVAIVLALTGAASIFSDFGLSLASIANVELTQQQKTTLFYSNIAIGILLAALVIALAAPYAVFANQPEIYPITIAMSTVFIFMGLGAQHRVEFSLQQRYKQFSKIEFVAFLVSSAVSVLTLFFGFGVWALVVQVLTFPLIRTVVSASFSRWSPSSILMFSFVSIRSMVKFGNSATALSFLYFLTSNLDTVLVGRFYGSMQAGLYNRAFQIANLPIVQLMAPLTRVFIPILAVSSSEGTFKETAHKVQKYLGYTLFLPLSALVALYQPWVPIIFGPDWIPSIEYFWFFSVAVAVQAMGYIYYWIFLSLGKPNLLLRAEMPGRLIMIALMILCIPLGPIAIAASVGVGQVFILLLTVLFQAPKVGFAGISLFRELRVPIAVGGASVIISTTAYVYSSMLSLTELESALLVSIVWLVAIFGSWRYMSQDLVHLYRQVRGAKPN